MNRRTALGWGVGALAAAAGLSAAWLGRRKEGSADELWGMRFQKLGGGELALAELRGRPILLNFWATWCAPCVVEMPLLGKFQRERRDAGWQVIGLAIDNQAAVQKFVRERGIDFTIVLGGADGLQLLHLLGNRGGGLPYSVAFDAAGRRTASKLGVLDENTLADWAAKTA